MITPFHDAMHQSTKPHTPFHSHPSGCVFSSDLPSSASISPTMITTDDREAHASFSAIYAMSPILPAAASHPNTLLTSPTCLCNAEIRFKAASPGFLSEILIYAPCSLELKISMILGVMSFISGSLRSMLARTVCSHSSRWSMFVSRDAVIATETLRDMSGATRSR